MKKILWRFIKVVYFAILVVGIILSLVIFNDNLPRTETTTIYHPIVKCNNGKNFDPYSKPIDIVDVYSSVFHGFIPDGAPAFDDRQVSSECQFSTAYFVGAQNLERGNYDINYNSEVKSDTTGSLQNAFLLSFKVFVIYIIILEILRRTFTYVVLGKSFFSGR